MAPKSKLTVQNRLGITNNPVESLAMRYLIEIESQNPRILQEVEHGLANFDRTTETKRYTRSSRVERMRAREEVIASRRHIQNCSWKNGLPGVSNPPKRRGLKDFTGRDRKFMANYRDMKLRRFRQIRDAGEKLLNFLLATEQYTGDIRTNYTQIPSNLSTQQYPEASETTFQY